MTRIATLLLAIVLVSTAACASKTTRDYGTVELQQNFATAPHLP